MVTLGFQLESSAGSEMFLASGLSVVNGVVSQRVGSGLGVELQSTNDCYAYWSFDTGLDADYFKGGGTGSYILGDHGISGVLTKFGAGALYNPNTSVHRGIFPFPNIPDVGATGLTFEFWMSPGSISTNGNAFELAFGLTNGMSTPRPNYTMSANISGGWSTSRFVAIGGSSDNSSMAGANTFPYASNDWSFMTISWNPNDATRHSRAFINGSELSYGTNVNQITSGVLQKCWTSITFNSIQGLNRGYAHFFDDMAVYRGVLRTANFAVPDAALKPLNTFSPVLWVRKDSSAADSTWATPFKANLFEESGAEVKARFYASNTAYDLSVSGDRDTLDALFGDFASGTGDGDGNKTFTLSVDTGRYLYVQFQLNSNATGTAQARVFETPDAVDVTIGAIPSVSSVTLSATSISGAEKVTVTATIANAVTEAAVEINSKSFGMTLSSGTTYTATISARDIGLLTTGTVTVFAVNNAGGGHADSASTLTVTNPTINSPTALHDLTVWLRDSLINNLTDPISANRSSDSKFVMTSFPQRKVEYPLIVVEITNVESKRLGARSEDSLVTYSWQVQIYSLSAKQRDTLYDSVYDFLRTFQLGSAESIDKGIYNFNIVSANNLSEDGARAVHRKIINGTYQVITNG